MSNLIIEGILDLDEIKYLQEIKDHTKYKIKYIKEYVKKWLNVAINKTNKVEFIDAMCNAGVYAHNICTTSLEVIQIFNYYALNNRNKNFYVYLNDLDTKKINIYKKIIYFNKAKICGNLKICFSNDDVIDYLNKKKQSYKNYNEAMTLLYVDPYNFGINNLIKTITSFVDNVYCELIFNFFSSDINRNSINETAKEKKESIRNEIKGFIPFYNPDEMDAITVLDLLQQEIKKTKNIKYSFAYQFRNSKNVPLYYIVYFTPNVRGIELLKDTIWDVFEGDDNYYSKNRKQDHRFQNLFGETLIDYNIQRHVFIAIKLLEKSCRYNMFTYSDVNTIILEKTILNKSHIIKNILKPLIKKGIIEKMNIVNKNNYTEDSYRWCDNETS